MATKPTQFLDWIPSNSPASITDPPSGQKNSGWVPGQVPPAQFTNWQLNLIDRWIKWFDSPTGIGQETITANTVVDNTIGLIFADVSAGSISSVELPPAAGNEGYRLTLKNISIGSSNTVTLVPAGADTIENQASVVLAAGEYITVVSDGVLDYWQIG